MPCSSRKATSPGVCPPQKRFAFTNYHVSVGLQDAAEMPAKVAKLNDHFETYRAGDEYDTVAIEHVMAGSSHFPGRPPDCAGEKTAS